MQSKKTWFDLVVNLPIIKENEKTKKVLNRTLLGFLVFVDDVAGIWRRIVPFLYNEIS